MLAQPYLQVIGADGTRLLHALRFDNAQWTTTGDVERQAGNPGPIRSVACAPDGGDLHLFAATTDSVFHTRRYGDGTWTPFDDVGAKSGTRWRGVQHIACATYFGKIHLCGVDAAYALIHSLFSASQWTPPDVVSTQAGGPSHYIHVACTEFGNELHVFGAPAEQKGLRHTIRHPDGTWLPMEELIEFTPQEVGYILRVACATVLGDVHVLAVDLNSQLWHLLWNSKTHDWSNFSDVKTKTGNPGTIRALAATDCADELHVLASTNDRQNWRHTIRHSNDTWQPFGDVWLATDGVDQPGLLAVATAGTERPSNSPALPATPALAFEFNTCLPGAQTGPLTTTISAAVQNLGTASGVVAGLLGGAQFDLACVNDHERGGIFIYSESQQAMDAGLPSLDLLTRTHQDPGNNFAVLFSHSAIVVAIAAVWDTFRQIDGSISLPTNHDVRLHSYSIDYPSPQKLRLNITGLYTPLSAGFTVHYVDTFYLNPVSAPPDGLPNQPHWLVLSSNSSSLDVDAVFDLAMVFVVPGVINAILGGIGVSRGAPPLPATLPNGFGGVIAQAFLPKVYISGKEKLVMQYQGALTSPEFGVEAYGSVDARQRVPTIDLYAFPLFRSLGMRRKGGPGDGPARHAIGVTAIATTDDMRNPKKFSFSAPGLNLTNVTDPVPSADGTRFTSMASFKVPARKSSANITVTATDDEMLSQSATVSVPLFS